MVSDVHVRTIDNVRKCLLYIQCWLAEWIRSRWFDSSDRFPADACQLTLKQFSDKKKSFTKVFRIWFEIKKKKFILNFSESFVLRVGGEFHRQRSDNEYGKRFWIKNQNYSERKFFTLISPLNQQKFPIYPNWRPPRYSQKCQQNGNATHLRRCCSMENIFCYHRMEPSKGTHVGPYYSVQRSSLLSTPWCLSSSYSI